MSHADYLRELLRPLRVYELTGTANGGELEAVGEALDGSGAALDEVQREPFWSSCLPPASTPRTWPPCPEVPSG